MDTMKDKQQYFKYDTIFNGQPMQGMKDWADVVFISSECYESRLSTYENLPTCSPIEVYLISNKYISLEK